MQIEIDQSGKIEDTSKLTIVAYSNHCSKSLLITAKDKKIIQSVFRKIKQPRVFISKVFAAVIFILIKDDFKKINTVIVDTEYPGHSNTIKRYLIDFIKQEKMKSDRVDIYFHCIGKKSKAHDVAWKAYRKKKADMKINTRALFQIIFK